MTGSTNDFGVNQDGDGNNVGLWFSPDRDVTIDENTYVTMTDEELDALAHQILDAKCRVGKCFRCGEEVGEEIGVIALDAGGRSDCPAADEPDMPHEIDPPEGWED